MDFSFSLELTFLKRLPKLESTWAISDQPPSASVTAARSTGRCPKTPRFHHFWTAGSSYARTNQTGFPINSPFHSRVKNGSSCSPAGTPSSAPAPPEPSLQAEEPRCCPFPILCPSGCRPLPRGLTRAVDRLHPRPPRNELPRCKATAGPGRRRRGCCVVYYAR